MAFMQWTDAFVTGISQIDQQHRWLVESINQLHDEISGKNADKEVVYKILHGLIDYTFNHFIVEEDLFKRFDYPKTDAHLEEHNKFTRDTAALLEKFEGGETLRADALEFLREWLSHHILTVDMAYVPFMKENGV